MSQQQKHALRAMGLMSVILSQLVGSILVGILFGRWLDNTVGTEPLFLIFFLLIGLASGVYAMTITIRQFFSGD